MVAANRSKIHTSRGQRRYRNSFRRPSTFSRGPLLPGFSPQRRWPGPDNDLRHDRAGAECVPGSHRVLVCHAPRATKHNHRSIFQGASFPRTTLSRYSFLFPIAVKFGGMSRMGLWILVISVRLFPGLSRDRIFNRACNLFIHSPINNSLIEGSSY